MRTHWPAIRCLAAEEPHQAAGSWCARRSLHGSDSQRLLTTHGESSGRDRWTKQGNRTRRALIGRCSLSRSRQRMHRIRRVSTCRIERRHCTQASFNAGTEAHPPPFFSKAKPPVRRPLDQINSRGLPGVSSLVACRRLFCSCCPPCLTPFAVAILESVCLYHRLIILLLLFLLDLVAGTAYSTLHHRRSWSCPA